MIDIRVLNVGDKYTDNEGGSCEITKKETVDGQLVIVSKTVESKV